MECYKELISSIDLNELEETIVEVPNGKATEELEISNEMIKRLSLEAKEIFLEICNFCLREEIVPKA